MKTNLQWKNLKALVETPRQHVNSIRKSTDGLYLGSINRRNLFIDDN